MKKFETVVLERPGGDGEPMTLFVDSNPANTGESEYTAELEVEEPKFVDECPATVVGASDEPADVEKTIAEQLDDAFDKLFGDTEEMVVDFGQ